MVNLLRSAGEPPAKGPPDHHTERACRTAASPQARAVTLNWHPTGITLETSSTDLTVGDDPHRAALRGTTIPRQRVTTSRTCSY
jgi:hypothetical protein